jgi:hypothetical protein
LTGYGTIIQDRSKSMKATVMNGTGGREMLEYVERPDPAAGPSEALVEIALAGVNFMDIGVRQGMAWTEVPGPKILGVEGVGRVLAAGDAVEGIEPGQRVAWVYAPGSYAQRIAIPAASLVPIPDTIDDRTAASVMMQGLTASHFATDFYPVQPGDIAFVHAAAGGVGRPTPTWRAAGPPASCCSSRRCRPAIVFGGSRDMGGAAAARVSPAKLVFSRSKGASDADGSFSTISIGVFRR